MLPCFKHGRKKIKKTKKAVQKIARKDVQPKPPIRDLPKTPEKDFDAAEDLLKKINELRKTGFKCTPTHSLQGNKLTKEQLAKIPAEPPSTQLRRDKSLDVAAAMTVMDAYNSPGQWSSGNTGHLDTQGRDPEGRVKEAEKKYYSDFPRKRFIMIGENYTSFYCPKDEDIADIAIQKWRESVAHCVMMAGGHFPQQLIGIGIARKNDTVYVCTVFGETNDHWMDDQKAQLIWND